MPPSKAVSHCCGSCFDPPRVNSNNPAHRYFLTTDPVTGRLYVSDTNSRRIYRPVMLSGARDLIGKKSALPPVAKLRVCVSKCVWSMFCFPTVPPLHPPNTNSTLLCARAVSPVPGLYRCLPSGETNVCLCDCR